MSGLILVGCGNSNTPFGLDGERLQESVAKQALTYATIEKGGYIEEDIELVSVCAAVKKGNAAFGHQGDYVVFWQTLDEEIQEYNWFNEDNYIVEFGANSYEEYEDMGCHNFKE